MMGEQRTVKLTGSIAWIDLVTGETVDKGRASRVILRPSDLVMDLGASQGTYSVSLKRISEFKFDGTWTTRGPRERSGRAQCSLEPKDDFYTLVGTWEPGDQIWCGRLEAVDKF